MRIRESMINQTKGYRFYDGDWYEPWFASDDTPTRKVFDELRKEYGRCVSKMYRDPDARQIGWVFEKRMRYEDARTNKPEDFYIREVWVEIAESVETVPPKTIVKPFDF